MSRNLFPHPESSISTEIMREPIGFTGTGAPGTMADTPVMGEKNPAFAAVLSLLFPGLGQVCNGETVKGLLVLFGIYDAWATSRRMNVGTVPFREAGLATVVLFMVVWTAGVLAFLTLLALAAVAAFTMAL